MNASDFQIARLTIANWLFESLDWFNNLDNALKVVDWLMTNDYLSEKAYTEATSNEGEV